MPKSTCHNCLGYTRDNTAFFINLHMLVHPLEMKLLRGRTNIYLIQLREFYSKWRLLNSLGQMEFLQIFFLINRMPFSVLELMFLGVLFPNKSLLWWNLRCLEIYVIFKMYYLLLPNALKCVFLGYFCLKKGYQHYHTKFDKCFRDYTILLCTFYF